jgi:hypothetical protein
MANTIFSSTEGAALNVDAWSSEILAAYTRKLVMAKCCTDVSKWAHSPGGFVTLEIPAPTLLNSGAATALALTVGNNAAITFYKETTAKVTITISYSYYLATGVSEAEQAVSGYDIIQMYTPNIAEGLSRTIDGLLTTLVTSLTTNDVGALIEDPTFEDILYSIQLLDDGDVPQDNRNFVGSNAFGSALKKMGQITSIDYTDSKPLSTGEIGKLVGIPFQTCNNMAGTAAAGHDNFLGRTDCIGYTMPLGPHTRKFDDIKYLDSEVAISAVFGCGVMRQAAGVRLRGP